MKACKKYNKGGSVVTEKKPEYASYGEGIDKNIPSTFAEKSDREIAAAKAAGDMDKVKALVKIRRETLSMQDGGVIPGYKKRTQRKMSRAHEKAEKAGEKPVMYRTVRGKGDPRTLSQTSKKVPVYAKERKIQNEADYKMAEKEGRKNVRQLEKQGRQYKRKMSKVGPPKGSSSPAKGIGFSFKSRNLSSQQAAKKQGRQQTKGRKGQSRRSGCSGGASWCKD